MRLAEALREVGAAMIAHFTLGADDLPTTPQHRKGREANPLPNESIMRTSCIAVSGLLWTSSFAGLSPCCTAAMPNVSPRLMPPRNISPSATPRRGLSISRCPVVMEDFRHEGPDTISWRSPSSVGGRVSRLMGVCASLSFRCVGTHRR